MEQQRQRRNNSFITRMYPTGDQTSISIGGVELVVEDGYVEVPANLVGAAQAHGFTTQAPAEEVDEVETPAPAPTKLKFAAKKKAVVRKV